MSLPIKKDCCFHVNSFLRSPLQAATWL